MPVLPLVGSSSSRPGWCSPDDSAASIIALATRSLIEPVGFCPSSFAYTRTSPTRRSSTSGVLPIRSSSDGATTLGIAPPQVDGRAQLPEQLVDAPHAACRIGAHGRVAVTLGQLGGAAMQAREPEQVVLGIPAAFLDHALAPFAAQLGARDEGQAGTLCAALDRGRLCARRHDG